MVAVIPARDEQNLGISYLVLILLSGMVMFLIFRIRKKARLQTN